MTEFRYELLKTDGKARRGRLHTAHGTVETPFFKPVGTLATVKAMKTDDVKKSGAEMILCNAYHLYLRPGHKLVEEMGGLQKFMNWDGPILTDSGGFQVFSLSDLRKMSEKGVEFRSHIDGSKHMLTPELSTQVQHSLNATITMAFDECTPFPATERQARESMELSMRWAKRSRDAFVKREGYGQYGIMQGGMFQNLRRVSSEILKDLNFEGYSIGGLSVGEPPEQLHSMTDYCADLLPDDKPRYLMGVGYPSDIIHAVMSGIDHFDCVLPTRNARMGQAFVACDDSQNGVINIKQKRFEKDESPLDPTCECHTCQNYSRAYLRHLFINKEPLSPMLMTEHNTHFYQNLMKTLRKAIEDGNLKEISTELLKKVR